MGRLAKLTAMQVQRLNTRGRYADGGGLYLQVSKSGTKAWLFRFMLNRKAREMGLGPVRDVSLAEARDLAAQARKLLARGEDPLEAKNLERQQRLLEAAKAITFKECALEYIKMNEAGWSNPKHREQWETTLETYAFPVIGDLPIQRIETDLVVRILEPIWRSRTETASRLRGRIENILSYATARKWREGQNPARWRGHLDHILPRPSDVRSVEHHAALEVKAVPAFMSTLRRQDGIAARALEFAILTAARTGEVIYAKWDEFDLDAGVWTVPAERMKHGKEHRVPLSKRAQSIIEAMKAISSYGYVFPGRGLGKPLSNMSMLQLLKKRMHLKITAHGFRSTFRDWVSETTNFSHEVVEMSLAHTIANKVEAAYRRGDLFIKRRELMQAWSEYCLLSRPAQSEVVSMECKLA